MGGRGKRGGGGVTRGNAEGKGKGIRVGNEGAK